MRPTLDELGWQRAPDGTVFQAFPWIDGADDAVVVATMALRDVFMISSPAQMEEPSHYGVADGVLPASPAPTDVVRPASAGELLAVIGPWCAAPEEPS